MENKEYKIGQQIEFKEDFNVKTFNGRKLEVKKGDKAVVNSKGFIEYISGNSKGIRQVVEGMIVKDYDHRNIAEMIYNRLNLIYGLENFVSDEEIEYSEMIDEMEDVLCEIL